VNSSNNFDLSKQQPKRGLGLNILRSFDLHVLETNSTVDLWIWN